MVENYIQFIGVRGQYLFFFLIFLIVGEKRQFSRNNCFCYFQFFLLYFSLIKTQEPDFFFWSCIQQFKCSKLFSFIDFIGYMQIKLFWPTKILENLIQSPSEDLATCFYKFGIGNANCTSDFEVFVHNTIREIWSTRVTSGCNFPQCQIRLGKIQQ